MVCILAGKVLSALVHGMQDRNVTVRRCSAAACGNVCRAARPSSVEKLIAKLRAWYLEGEGVCYEWSVRQNICRKGSKGDISANFEALIW